MALKIDLFDKKKFVLKYFFQAILSLLVVFGGLYLFKILYYDHNPDFWFDKFYRNPLIIHIIYVASEVLFGIFPPELFMVWAIKAGGTISYVLNILFFTVVSFGAGHLAYWIGRLLSKKVGKNIRKKKFVAKYLPVVRRFGGIIIVISALTPLPWATICLIMGIIDFRYSSFTYYSLSRIVRFIVNGFLIFQTGAFFF